MARVLLAPVLDRAPARVSRRAAACESRPLTTQPSSLAPGGVGAVVAPARRRAADGRVVGVEDVDERPAGRNCGSSAMPEQPAVPEVVHLRAQVGVDRGRRVVDVVVDLDDAALLRDEDTPVRREPHGHRPLEARDRGALGEAAGSDRGRGREAHVGDRALVGCRRRSRPRAPPARAAAPRAQRPSTAGSRAGTRAQREPRIDGKRGMPPRQSSEAEIGTAGVSRRCCRTRRTSPGGGRGSRRGRRSAARTCCS